MSWGVGFLENLLHIRMERMAIIALPVKFSLLSKEAKCPFLYSNYIFCFRGEDFLIQKRNTINIGLSPVFII